jgi:hypothetical protein
MGAGIHHDVDVREDGTIRPIQVNKDIQLPRGLDFIATPCAVDSLVHLSPEGKLFE